MAIRNWVRLQHVGIELLGWQLKGKEIALVLRVGSRLNEEGSATAAFFRTKVGEIGVRPANSAQAETQVAGAGQWKRTGFSRSCKERDDRVYLGKRRLGSGAASRRSGIGAW